MTPIFFEAAGVCLTAPQQRLICSRLYWNGVRARVDRQSRTGNHRPWLWRRQRSLARRCDGQCDDPTSMGVQLRGPVGACISAHGRGWCCCPGLFFSSSQLSSACSPCLSFPWAIPFDAGMMRPAFEGIGSRCAGWFSSCLSSLCVDSHDDDDGQRQQDQALRNDG